MKKMWRGAAMFLLLAAGALIRGIPASAAVNINGKEIICLWPSETFRCDLNKDGKKETLRCSYSNGSGRDLLYVNGKIVLSSKSKYSNGYWIHDLNKKDRYLEIYVWSKLPGKSVFLRYNGRKMVRIADSLYGDGKVFKSMPAETDFWLEQEQPGNGTYIAYMVLGGFPANQGYGGYIPMKMKCRIVNKKMRFLASAEHELCTFTVNMYNEIDYTIAPKASGTLIAYNKPALKGVRVNFTLRKGDKYTYLKVKFSTPYSFIQIKNLKTGKTGWVGVKTSQLKLLPKIPQK